MKRPTLQPPAGSRGALATAVYIVVGVLMLSAFSSAPGTSAAPDADASTAAGAAASRSTSASASPSASASALPSPSLSPSASPGVSGTLTTAVTEPVTVHSGEVARVRYRVDDIAGGTATVTLLVTKVDGAAVRRLAGGIAVETGVEQVWRGRVRLRRGRYLLVARAVDASGRRQASTRSAHLRVLAPLPPLVPAAKARRAAFAWAARRAGDVAVAVVDSRGRLYGYRATRRFTTASVVKAVMLVAYLRRHDTLSASMRETLRSMITRSDNASADVVYRLVGRAGVQRFARRAGMRSFTAGSSWIVSRVDAADMARFFRDMRQYVPPAHRRFADSLLSGIVSWQSWGIPAAARPLGYRVYFKPGWLGAWVLANQAARLERGRVRIGLAVFTDDNPTSAYGKDTVAGVTARLLSW